MKIEKMCSKQDLISNLKKAASYSKIEHLKKLAEYIQIEIDLPNLKEQLLIKNYEIEIKNGKYYIVEQQSKFDSEKNIWETLEKNIIAEIPIEEVEKIIL